MELPRLSKDVRSIVQLQRDDDGTLVPSVIYRAERRKKRGSSTFKPLEKTVRKIAKSQTRFAGTYLKKHARSNEKRKDGWMKDLVTNLTNAESKGRKSLTKNGMRWPAIIRLA
jgi:hypothetical protein